MTQIDKFPEPPEHLSQKSRNLYNFYVGLTIKAPGQIALFVKGLESLDTADQAAELIREEGLSQKSERSGLRRQHPLLNTQKKLMATFLRIWKVLGLNENQYLDGVSYRSFV